MIAKAVIEIDEIIDRTAEDGITVHTDDLTIEETIAVAVDFEAEDEIVFPMDHDHLEKCTRRRALTVGRNVKFLSNQKKTGLCIAEIVFKTTAIN